MLGGIIIEKSAMDDLATVTVNESESDNNVVEEILQPIEGTLSATEEVASDILNKDMTNEGGFPWFGLSIVIIILAVGYLVWKRFQ